MSDIGCDTIPDHKLCGYLCTVATVRPPRDHHDITINTRLRTAVNGSEVQFVSENDVVLLLFHSSRSESREDSAGSGSLRKKSNKIGGSSNVVRQLHTLIMHQCLRIVARVINVSSRQCERQDEVRVVVLVDVYLPISLWFGWQFPKFGTAAAALLKHLSCDWEARRSLVTSSSLNLQDYNIWNLPACNVLGCKIRWCFPEASKRKLFDLHEIFKTLPSVTKKGYPHLLKINPAQASSESGIWLVPDDVLISILSALDPIDLVRVASTCHHLRSLASPIMPCMKLKLFPHQEAAIFWMLQRERDSEVIQHPLYLNFCTEDGFSFYVNSVSGEIVAGVIPMVKDFRGGMFCDEPGLGKTITALSLILKTQGTLADPPEGTEVIWCMHNSNQRCGYYEIKNTSQNKFCDSTSPHSRVAGSNPRRQLFCLDDLTPTRDPSFTPTENDNFLVGHEQTVGSTIALPDSEMDSHKMVDTALRARSICSSRTLCRTRRSLLNAYDEASAFATEKRHPNGGNKRKKHSLDGAYNGKKPKIVHPDILECNETWIQCDACCKWRKLVDASVADTSGAWFCSMNTMDPSHQSCSIPEESGDYESIKYLPGFHLKGTPGGLKENILFFTGVLKEHRTLINSGTKRILTWLVKLPAEQLSEMETIGLAHPVAELCMPDQPHPYHKIFEAFGLIKKVEKHVTKWHYPKSLLNLTFDLDALRVALCEPLDLLRLYLSRATLIVVPANLVQHWTAQIEKHVKPGQLRIYVWTDQKSPSPHHLAWDYDVVITTFSRLSAEGSHKKRSALLQVHWLRVMLDEGHTLGSSLNLTNKLKMAILLNASSRWVLTGTPTPNTPNSQLSHLQPMLKFLHEEVYGLDRRSWEDGILKPFEAEMEEGRLRLLQLLQRCMISAKKVDLQTIPPCNRAVKLIDFTKEHAKSYNELVETVRRNILTADWNDPSHVESLLNPRQWKPRSDAIRNLRLSCCVAGHVQVRDAGQDIQETMDILGQSGLETISQEYSLIKHNLLNGGNCMRCREWCRLPVITPCRHLLCLDCVALDSERCMFPGCGNMYEMQNPDMLTRPENPNPKWPVPKDLIELQPSYKQDNWNPDWESTLSSKVSYLVNRLKELQETNGEIDCSKYGMFFKNPDEFNSLTMRCKTYKSLDSKISTGCGSTSSMALPVKVIIFSQFLEHINAIHEQLTKAGIQFASLYSPLHSYKKAKGLAAFLNDVNCLALLMDGSAALGLDLSFVTHVYLMEPIWDKSMEEQVISRAHRMGARRPIQVETLAMKGTIEEQMLKFLESLQDSDVRRRLLEENFSKQDSVRPRVPRTLHDFAESNYLAQLRFVRTN